MHITDIEVFRHFMEHSPCMAWIYDHTGKYTYANQKFCDFNHQDDVVGKTLFDVFRFEDATRFKQKSDLALSTSTGVEYVENVMDGDRQYKFLIHKFPVNLHGKIFVGGCALDITTYFNLQDELAFHSYILDNIDTAVVGVDLNKQVFYWNKYATELYGWSRKDVIGNPLPVLTLNTPEVRLVVSNVWTTLYNGETWKGEFTAMHKNGSKFPVYVVNTPILDQQTKQVKAVVGISSDLSHKKMLEETLEKNKQSLQQIAFMQSHELRRPVANILGLLPLLSNMAATNPQDRQVLDLLKASVTELDQVIKAIVGKTKG